MDNKVIVTNMASGMTVLKMSNMNVRIVWERKGAKKPVPFDILEQAMYHPGNERLLRSGILYIEDMETKIKLGLEEEDTKEPTKIIVLSDAQMKRYLTVMPLVEFEKNVKELSVDQCKELVSFAVKNGIDAYEKGKILKEITNLDLTTMLAIRRAEVE